MGSEFNELSAQWIGHIRESLEKTPQGITVAKGSMTSGEGINPQSSMECARDISAGYSITFGICTPVMLLRLSTMRCYGRPITHLDTLKTLYKHRIVPYPPRLLHSLIRCCQPN